MRLRTLWVILGLALIATASLPASVHTWKGSGATGDVTLAGNWAGGNVPAFDGSVAEDLHFGNPVGTQYNPLISASGIIVRDLKFIAASRPTYTFSGTGLPTFEVRGDISIVVSGGDVIFDNTVKLKLSAGIHNFDLTPAGSVLTIDSVITGAGQINKNGAGTLNLSGANTFSGGLNLNGGDLSISNSAALGTGTFTMADLTRLFGLGNLAVTNAVILTSGNVDVTLGRNDNLALDGILSGLGQINTYGAGSLALGGDNAAWSGGLTLWGDGMVDLNHANALGTGWLNFDSASYGEVNVNQSMTIYGISGNSTFSEIYLYAGATLTINQATDSTFDGYISDGVSPGSLVKTGTGALTLTGDSDYTGTTTIDGGALIASGNGASLGYNTITINNGGTLAVINGAYLSNDVQVNFGGTLSGTGHVSNGFINAGGILAPGGASCPIGQLSFDDLTLGTDGQMQWHAKDPTSYDSISVYNAATLTILSTSSNPFVLRLISLDASDVPGMATGFTRDQQYNFLIFSTSGISGFDPTYFTIDSSMFTTDGGPDGIFSVSKIGNDIFLNFTPVPEPSTYVLLAGGAGLIAYLRRRRIFRR